MSDTLCNPGMDHWRPEPTTLPGKWKSVSCSYDGSTAIAIRYGLGVDSAPSYDEFDFGGIYITNDSGQTWKRRILSKQQFKTGYFYQCLCSGDGSKFIVTHIYEGIFISTDNGLTWNNISKNILDSQYIATTIIAASSNFNKIYTINNNQILISDDGGLSWVAKDFISRNILADSGTVSGICCSRNGNIIYISMSMGKLYVSINGGNSWISRNSKRNWSGVACSSDGSRLVAVDAGQNWNPKGKNAREGNPPILGSIYISNNYGSTFNTQWLPDSELKDAWSSVACNYDGSIITVSSSAILDPYSSYPYNDTNNYTGYSYGKIYIIKNDTVQVLPCCSKYSPNIPGKNWTSVALSDDGTKFYATSSYLTWLNSLANIKNSANISAVYINANIFTSNCYNQSIQNISKTNSEIKAKNLYYSPSQPWRNNNLSFNNITNISSISLQLYGRQFGRSYSPNSTYNQLVSQKLSIPSDIVEITLLNGLTENIATISGNYNDSPSMFAVSFMPWWGSQYQANLYANFYKNDVLKNRYPPPSFLPSPSGSVRFAWRKRMDFSNSITSYIVDYCEVKWSLENTTPIINCSYMQIDDTNDPSDRFAIIFNKPPTQYQVSSSSSIRSNISTGNTQNSPASPIKSSYYSSPTCRPNYSNRNGDFYVIESGPLAGTIVCKYTGRDGGWTSDTPTVWSRRDPTDGSGPVIDRVTVDINDPRSPKSKKPPTCDGGLINTGCVFPQRLSDNSAKPKGPAPRLTIDDTNNNKVKINISILNVDSTKYPNNQKRGGKRESSKIKIQYRKKKMDQPKTQSIENIDIKSVIKNNKNILGSLSYAHRIDSPNSIQNTIEYYDNINKNDDKESWNVLKEIPVIYDNDVDEYIEISTDHTVSDSESYEYFFRYCEVDEFGDGEMSDPASVVLGEPYLVGILNLMIP